MPVLDAEIDAIRKAGSGEPLYKALVAFSTAVKKLDAGASDDQLDASQMIDEYIKPSSNNAILITIRDDVLDMVGHSSSDGTPKASSPEDDKKALQYLEQARTIIKGAKTGYDFLEAHDYIEQAIGISPIVDSQAESDLIEALEDVMVEEANGGLKFKVKNTSKLLRIQDDLLTGIETVLKKVDIISRARDLSATQKVEKEFLSEKVPATVAQNITSFLTGKRGSIGAQESQLRTEYGKSGVQGKGSKGGRKTKKKRSSKKKTHGRRV